MRYPTFATIDSAMRETLGLVLFERGFDFVNGTFFRELSTGVRHVLFVSMKIGRAHV